MDHFGIGAALRGALNVYFCGARRTGRTTSLLESLCDGDRVICLDTKNSQHLQRLLRERNLKVEVIVVDVANPTQLFERSTSEGRTLFDHTWVEKFYENAIADAAKCIDRWQTESSGYGTEHIRTRQAAIEAKKFGF